MLSNIQVLRALAAFLVVIVHLQVLATFSGLPSGITAAGNCGVDLFFVISGLIMVVTTAQRDQSAGEFMRNRVTRIVPLYWVVTIVVFCLAIAAPSLFQSTTVSPSALLKSLGFVPYARADGVMAPIVFVGWSLNYEMMFYVMFALGMLLSGSRALGQIFTITMLGLCVGAGQLFQPSDAVIRFYSSPVTCEFGGGIILGMFFVSGRLPRSASARFPALMVGLMGFVAMLVAPQIWPDADRSVVCGLPAFFVVGSFLIAESAGLAFKASWLQLLGAASYAIYLTHFFSTQVVVLIAPHLARFGAPIMLALGALAFISVGVVGIAVHLWLELPLTARVRRLSGQLRKNISIAAKIEPEAEGGPAPALALQPVALTDGARTGVAAELQR